MAAGDRPAPRPARSRRAARRGGRGRRPRPAIPRFATVRLGEPAAPSPRTDARIAELAGAGLNVALPAWNDSGTRSRDNLARLDLARRARHALPGVGRAASTRVVTLGIDTAAGGALLDSIVADYRDAARRSSAATSATSPARARSPLLGARPRALRARDPAHPAWNNLLGRAAFASRAALGALHAGLRRDRCTPPCCATTTTTSTLAGDRGQFVENAAGARAHGARGGLPFWSIVLLVAARAVPRAHRRASCAGRPRMLLAYGARGIGYFTYWTPAPDPAWNWQPAMIALRRRAHGLVPTWSPR